MFFSGFLGLLLAVMSGGAANVVQLENAKTGTNDWQLSNPATGHQIEGYASLTSVNRGGQISLFVNTSDPTYTMKIFRLGWYGGTGGRLMTNVINRTGNVQAIPTPDTNGMVECNWTNAYVLNIPFNPSDATEWASGVYLVKLTGSSGKQSYIMFVVRDDARAADFLFQSSVTTFQAYNYWGGKSLYDWGSAGVTARKVSFNRPYTGSSNTNAAHGVGAGDFICNDQPVAEGYPISSAGHEINMLRFLEREGYDVSYCTDIDTHADPNLLLSRKGFLCVGHDEYWSWDMRAHVEAARDQGVNLGFFAGNSCFWQVRFEPSQITGATNRTVVAYKEAALTNDPFALDGDPSNDHLITSLYRWSTLDRPEDALLGVMYNSNPVDADMVIEDDSNWVLAGTGLKNGDHLPGLVGYEVDRVWGNGPGTLQRISHSPYHDLDNPGGPLLYSDSTVYRAPSGAMVFAAGSIQWSWGLDDYNSPGLRTSRLNPAAQQITRNILAQFLVHAPLIARQPPSRTVVTNSTVTLSVAAPGPSSTFVKGINLFGPAVTIEGNAWLSHASALVQGLTVTSAESYNNGGPYSFPLVPATDADTALMLQSMLYTSENVSLGFSMNQALPNGSYEVYLWMVENYQNNFRDATVTLEGVAVANGIGDFARGQWKKYGPYAVPVTDGVLNVKVRPFTKDDSLVAGLAIFRTTGLNYQWRMNGTNLIGATNFFHALSNLQPTNSGSFTVVISNNVGAVTSAVSVLTVQVPAAITQQPVSLIVTQGNTTAFSVTATGTSLQYQWFFNGVNPVLQGTNASLSFNSVHLTNAGTYSVVVSNGVGAVTSAPVTLTVFGPPTILAQTAGYLLMTNGDSTVLSVTAVGNPAVNYQWQLNGTNLAGQTGPTLSLANVQPTNAGSYLLHMSNSFATVFSAPVRVEVVVRPVITAQPQGLTKSNGLTATFTVTATNLSSTYFKGINLNGPEATMEFNPWISYSNALLNGLTVSNAQVFATNSYGFTLSPAADTNTDLMFRSALHLPGAANGQGFTLRQLVTNGDYQVYLWMLENTANNSRSINVLLEGTTVVNGIADLALGSWQKYGPYTTNISDGVLTLDIQRKNKGVPILFGLALHHYDHFDYQWRFKGVPLTGATNATLTVSNLQYANQGDYTVLVGNRAGSLTSAVATLTVLALPAITQPPAPQSVVRSNDAVFTVAATGTVALTYRWRFNGTNLSASATNTTLIVANAQTNHAGAYSVVVSNAYGSVTSAPAALTVLVSPSIMTPPLPLILTNGGTGTFTALAAGTAPFSHQWWFNTTVPLPNATNASLSVVDAQSTNAGAYTVVITNLAGAVTSAPVTLTVLVLPAIATPPQSATVTNGSPATFTVIASGIPPPAYFWRLNVTNFVADATNATLTILNAQSTNSGNYSVIVSNLVGSVTSAPAVLTVLVPPAILLQPTNQSVIVGGTTNFTVIATGTAPLGYQWCLRATNLLVNETNATLTLTNAQATNAGNYSVVITNLAGAVTSAPAVLTILMPPTIVEHPTAQTVIQTSNTTFTVAATGTAPLTFQWRRDGMNLPGETSPALVMNNVTTNHAGAYTVVVTNNYGAVTSETAALIVLVPPSITTQPLDQTNYAGYAATFTVAAAGTAPLAYQWLFNLTNLLSGETNAFLTLVNLQTNQSGYYSVIVTNVAGVASSSAAFLTVNLLPSPVLRIARDSEVIVLSWAVSVSDFSLESATNLFAPVAWSPALPLPMIIDNFNWVTNSATNSPQFYRLKNIVP